MPGQIAFADNFVEYPESIAEWNMRFGSCPEPWCKSLAPIAATGGSGRFAQAAAPLEPRRRAEIDPEIDRPDPARKAIMPSNCRIWVESPMVYGMDRARRS